MRLLPGHIVGVDMTDLKQVGVSEQYVYKSTDRNRNGQLKSWDHTKEDGKLFVHYDSLPKHIQQSLKSCICDNLEPIEHLLCKIFEAQTLSAPDFKAFFESYTTDTGVSLRPDEVDNYTQSAVYLWVWVNRKELKLKEKGFTGRDSILSTLKTLKTLKKLRLPVDLKRITEKAKQWQSLELSGEVPAKCLIHGGLGNDRTVKVTTLSQTIIEELAAKHQGLAHTEILRRYNEIAPKAGLKSIKAPRTIRRYISLPDVASMRSGMNQFNKFYNPIISRDRPKVANRLWVGDGWTAELYYQKRVETENGGEVAKHWFRKTVYMVIDALNDYIVGYHISDTETVEDTKQAWKNAVVSAGVLPEFIKTDNWAWKELTPFYEAITGVPEKYIPSSVGNSRDKVIEPFFNKFNTQCLQRYPNWAGRGIKSKTNVNGDYLDKIKHDFPDESGVIAQIESAIQVWNKSCRRGCELERIEEWNQARRSAERTLTDTNRLRLFGIEHARKEGVTYTNKGVNITIGGRKVCYQEWENIEMQSNIGKQYNVLYDPENIGSILLYIPGTRETHLLKQDVRVPMVFGDFESGQREVLNQKLEYQKQAKARPVQKAQKRAEILEKEGIVKLLEDPLYTEAIAKVQPIEKGRQKELLAASEAKQKAKRDETYTPYKRGEIGELE